MFHDTSVPFAERRNITVADMENYKKFWESVTGRPYGTIKPESPKKKTGDRREGVEPNQRKQKQDNV